MDNLEVWEIETKINMDVISNIRDHQLNQSYNPDLLRIELSPILFEDKSKNDEYLLKIQFVFHTKGEKTLAQSVANYGRQLLAGSISRLSFLSNSPVINTTPPVLTFQYPNTNNFRKLFFPAQQANIRPPINIKNFNFMTKKIDQKLTNALNFLHESIISSDLIGSFIYLWSALEILTNLFDIQDFEPKTCANCGYVYQNNPGIADRIRYILTNYLSIDADLVEKIWKIRNEISHGGLELSDQKLIDVEFIRNDLYLIVRRLINLQIGNKDLQSDKSMPFLPFAGAILDIEYSV